MSEEPRIPDLNSERIFRYCEAARVYLFKVTFNLRTLIYDIPRNRKFKRARRRYIRANKGPDITDLFSVSGRISAELIYQYYRYSTLDDVRNRAIEEYQEYYNDLMARLKKLKRVKSLARWRMTSQKSKLKLYTAAKEANRALKKEYHEDINRLLFRRARALGAKKDIIWNEYLNDPDTFEEGLGTYLN